MQVQEVMTKDLILLGPDASVLEAASTMKKFNIGAVLIAENNKLEGILTDRDIVLRLIAENIPCDQAQVKDFMSQSPISVQSEEELDLAADIMAEHQIRRLPVVENNELNGIITLGDLAQKAAPEAEEVLEQCSKPIRGDIAA